MRAALFTLLCLPSAALAQAVPNNCRTASATCQARQFNLLAGKKLCLNSTTCTTTVSASATTAGMLFNSGTTDTANPSYIFDTTSDYSGSSLKAYSWRSNGTELAWLGYIVAGVGRLSVSGQIIASGDIITGGYFKPSSAGILGGGPVPIASQNTDGQVMVRLGAQNTQSDTGTRVVLMSNSMGSSPSDKAWVDLNGAFAGSSFLPTRRLGQWVIAQVADTAFTGIGLIVSAVGGTPSSAPTANGTMNMIGFQSGAVSGNNAGFTGSNKALTRFDFRPRYTAIIRTDSVVTSQRVYVGLDNGDPSGVSNLAGLNGNRLAVFRYDTGLGDTTWQAITSDGTTASATDTGVTVTASTTYTMQVDASVAGTFLFRINNAATPQVSKTTNLPTGTTDIGVDGVVTTLTSAARNIYVAHVYLEQN